MSTYIVEWLRFEHRSVSAYHQDDVPFYLTKRKRRFTLATLPIAATQSAWVIATASSEEDGYEIDATKYLIHRVIPSVLNTETTQLGLGYSKLK